MELTLCSKCSSLLCEGDCAAWIDGHAYSLRGLVKIWGIQARQVRKHLDDGTKPRCADGWIVRRTVDGRLLRPCSRRGSRTLYYRFKGHSGFGDSMRKTARAIGVPQSSLHDLVRQPSKPIPGDWKCDVLRTELGYHYRSTARALAAY